MPSWTTRRYLATESLLFAATGAALGYALAAHAREAWLVWVSLGWNLALLFVALEDAPAPAPRVPDAWDQLLADAAAMQEEARR